MRGSSKTGPTSATAACQFEPASILLLLIAVLIALTSVGAAKRQNNSEKPAGAEAAAVLWEYPNDIASRNLLRGPLSSKDEPVGPYVFVKEDLKGTNPKIDVRDAAGVKWKVKLGIEAKPEVAASRLVWAVGYYTYQYVFVPDLRVKNMPAHLHRGQELVSPDGSIKDVRLKKAPDREKKIAIWRWRRNPFIGTRAFNGLRVLMAVINNWDLKDINNAVLRVKSSRSTTGIQDAYAISDLGASFGTNNWVRPLSIAKGDLDSYRKSGFIRRVTPDDVDFDIGLKPSLINARDFPLYLQYVRMRWIGKNIPRSDARWMGDLLGKLSPEQIEDAFRAAGYSPQDALGFSQVVLKRIAELKKL